MKITKINIENFRNIEKSELEFAEGLNVLLGNNAEGKTNLMEAVFCFSNSRSFRGAKDRELVRFGSETAVTEGEFSKGDKIFTLKEEFFKNKRKNIYINGHRIEKMSDFFGNVNAVLFVPEYLKIVKNGPSERRSFLDFAISQIKPYYVAYLFRYLKTCEEKNAILRDYHGTNDEKTMIEVYNDTLIQMASKITKERLSYMDAVSDKVRFHFENMSGVDRLGFSFQIGGETGVDREKIDEYYKNAFENCLEADIRYGRMTVGCQKDDISFLINGKEARVYASQGQQRSAVIALKLAEGEVLGEKAGSEPIYLFDDVMSELDKSRQKYIIENLKNKQVIISTCNESDILKSDLVIRVEGGRYKK